MRHKIYILLILTLPVAGTVAGQCPGPAVRTALLNLQKAVSNPTFYTAQNSLAGQVPVSDTCGNLRYTRYVVISDTCLSANPFGPVVGLPPSTFIKICGTDSLFYIDWRREPLFLGVTAGSAADSINWYNSNDTTTSLLRTAYILKSAEWVGIDPTGFARIIIGDLAYGQVYADANEASIDHLDATGQSVVRTNTAGVEITTSQSASRALTIRTDTVNTAGSFDPTNFRVNFNSDFNYLYADSLTVLALGQFPAFPALNLDGTEKGFFYDPFNNGVLMISGDGTTGGYSYGSIAPIGIDLNVTHDAAASTSNFIGMQANPDEGATIIRTSSQFATHGSTEFNLNTAPNLNLIIATLNNRDTNRLASLYVGENLTGQNYAYAGPRAGGWRTQIGITSSPFDWIQTYLPNDTVSQTVSFYNRAYYFPNARPSNTAGDTSVIVWIGDGTNAGKHPEFVPLPGAGSTVNWYNSDGTTTENTRIADVLETATWRSDDVTQDGVVPFRWELAGGPTNEPEIMVWAFPNGDSLLLFQADQEIVFNSNNPTVFRSDLSTSLNAPTTSLSNNVGGSLSLNIDGTLSHSAQSLQYNLSNGSTGTSAVELLISGPFTPITLSANQTLNFRISLRARCTNVGNGVGISSGDSYASWVNGCIKRVGTTTSIVGSVQTPTTAQADTGMSTSVTTVDADDTDESLRVQFTPPSTAGTTTVIAITATVEITQ